MQKPSLSMQVRPTHPRIVFRVLVRHLREANVPEQDPFYRAVHSYTSNPGEKTATALFNTIDSLEEFDAGDFWTGAMEEVASEFAPYLKEMVDQIIIWEGGRPDTSPRLSPPAFYMERDLRLYCDRVYYNVELYRDLVLAA